MRLFAAIVPPPHCLDHLGQALAMVAASAKPSPQWMPEQNWHLTVAFYGETPEGAAAALADQWPDVVADLPPFDCALSGAGMFAHRTAWVGARVDDAAWQGLTRALAPGELGLDCREDVQERKRPHLTIARAAVGHRNSPHDVARAVAALSVYRGPDWTVGEVGLFASALGQGPGGHARHTRLASARLAGASAGPSGGPRLIG